MEKAKSISEVLSGLSYPGRGIIVGKSADGNCAVFAYFLTGRSANSRNRILVEKNGEVFTEPFDLNAVEDPSLIIYKAVGSVNGKIVVTNGDQTDTILSAISHGGSFEDALKTRVFEPDSPNYTPRISGVMDFDGGYSYTLSILRCADGKGENCERFFFNYPAIAGVGHFIRTYQGNGNPLPSFAGEPIKVAITGTPEEFSDTLWKALDFGNKIALIVRHINLLGGNVKTVLKNKLQGD